jgi:hypothetical protein
VLPEDEAKILEKELQHNGLAEAMIVGKFSKSKEVKLIVKA